MDTLTRDIGRLNQDLERRFSGKLQVNSDLDRSMVSFQGSRTEPVWRWLKFKEAFSGELVSYVLDRFCSPSSGDVLDPFAGTGSTIFGASARGCRGIGIEVLPVAIFDMVAKKAALDVSPEDFCAAAQAAAAARFEDYFDGHNPFDAVTITANAYPPASARAVCGYLRYCDLYDGPPPVKTLLRHAGMAVLESVSYTRKDGQYLRWDGRAPGRMSDFRKAEIEDFQSAIRCQLGMMCEDLHSFHHAWARAGERGDILIVEGSCLVELPRIPACSVQLVLTSPPYCNRYDYTRTYALELVYLGFDSADIKRLRQRLLSCTVENKEKQALLSSIYESNGSLLNGARRAVEGQELLLAILQRLSSYAHRGLLNNTNIVRMIANYFLEISVVIHEVARVLEPRGHFVMVNDNVRYAGVTIPVDLILSEIAEQAGLRTQCIWVLPQKKGNSSQQMGRYGRDDLRKSVYVWEKG